jgi:hypothetical protein
MAKEKARKQEDSEESESSDNEGKDNQIEEPEVKEVKVDINEVLGFKEKLVSFLNPGENVQNALKRLKGGEELGSHKIKTK